jgi:hypothetical protein
MTAGGIDQCFLVFHCLSCGDSYEISSSIHITFLSGDPCGTAEISYSFRRMLFFVLLSFLIFLFFISMHFIVTLLDYLTIHTLFTLCVQCFWPCYLCTWQTYVLDVHPFNPRIAMSAGYDGKTIVWDVSLQFAKPILYSTTSLWLQVHSYSLCPLDLGGHTHPDLWNFTFQVGRWKVFTVSAC